MKLKSKHEELRRHLGRWVDRARWPDYEITDADLVAYIQYESTGEGFRAAPLEWAKKTEEITIHQMWSEMAEFWASGYGWYVPLMDTIRREWSERRGSNIWMKKLLTIARSIKHRTPSSFAFIDGMMSYTGFSAEEKQRYLNMKFGPVKP